MMKANLKKMILAAAMAAFMVSAPAMAEEVEEEFIIEESFEETEEIAAETAASAVEIEVLGFETIAVAEVPTEVAQVAEVAETEANAVAEETEAIETETEAIETEAVVETEVVETEAVETETEAAEAQTFTYENDEVVITAQAAAELPENIEMQVRKLEEGSAEYEAAKAAAAESTEAAEDAQYSFYDVTFTVDGSEVELGENSVYVQVEFKTVQISSEVEMQEVLHIDEAGVNNVTAETEEGSNMSSVNFAM